MSFEAVPCMFKSRQEDGAEAFSLGLLIRPSSLVAAGVEEVVEKQQQQATTLPSSSCNQSTEETTTSTANSVPFALASTSSSTVQIVSSDLLTTNKGSAASAQQRPIRTSGNATTTSAMFSPQLVQLQQRTIGLLAPPGVPPILPRPPKQLQQQKNNNNNSKKGAKAGAKTKTTTTKGPLPILPRKTITAPTNLAQAVMVPIPVASTNVIAATTMATATGTSIITSNANTFELIQSPTQMVSTQFANQDALSIATTSACSMSSSHPSISSSSAAFLFGTSMPNNTGLLTIQSPPDSTTTVSVTDGKQEKGNGSSQKQRKNEKKAVEKQLSKKNAKKQTKQCSAMLITNQQNADKNNEQQMQQNQLDQQPRQQEALLGDDLHSIDFSQLVNSTVITTEDYLPSQSEPIYTANLDIYSNPGSSYQQQQQLSQINNVGQHHSATAQSHNSSIHSQQQHFTDSSNIPSIPIATSANTTVDQFCSSSAIYNLQNNQQQQHPLLHYPGPSTPTSCTTSGTQFSSTSSMSCQVRFAGQQHQLQPAVMAPMQQQQQQSTTSIAPWNPYILAHPGASHISSTPDSGIQSIDGSPPSVYTPPMVSPYSSQVRSCESVMGNNGHVASSANGGLGLSNINNAHTTMAGTSSYAMTLANNGIGTNACGTLNGATGICPNEMLLLMSNNNCRDIFGMNVNSSNQSLEQNGRVSRSHQKELCQTEQIDDAEDEPNDFSDMPKLLPVTHMDHDEEMLDNGQTNLITATTIAGDTEKGMQQEQKQQVGEQQQQSRNNFEDSTIGQTASNSIQVASTSSASTTPIESPTPSTKSKTKTTTCGEVLFHRDMSLQELAECISSNISPEELKQLTSLIQSKAAEAVAAATVAASANNCQQPRSEELKEKEGQEKEPVQKKKNNNNGKQKRRQRANNRDYNITVQTEKELQQHSGSNSSRCTSSDSVVLNEIGADSLIANSVQQQQQQPSTSNTAASISVLTPREPEQQEPKTKEQQQQRSLTREQKPKREKREGKMVTSTQIVMSQFKTKCESLATKVDNNNYASIALNQQTEPSQRPSSQSPFSKTEKDSEQIMPYETEPVTKNSEQIMPYETEPATIATTTDEQKVQQQKQQQEKLTAYRQLVQANLNRKFDAFRDRVCEQLQATHLNIRAEQQDQMPSTSFNRFMPLPWKQLNWTEVHQRIASRQIVSLQQDDGKQQQLKKQNGRRKNTNMETNEPEVGKTAKQQRNKKRSMEAINSNKDDDSIKRKRRRKEVPMMVIKLEDVVKNNNKNSQRSRSNTKRGPQIGNPQKKCSKQRTTPLILKLPKLIRRGQDAATDGRNNALLLTGWEPQLQSSPNNSKRDGSLQQRPPTVDTWLDLSYMDSAHPVGQWDPDAAAMFSTDSDNRDHDCVRCICGVVEDDGTMTQCDRCHFWLHADCLDKEVPDDEEFICDFCTRQLAITPKVDIILKPQPQIKLSGCTYFRTLVNVRGLQVRLNEAVYVERLINDKHKSILRELHKDCVRKQHGGDENGNATTTTPTKQRRDNSAGSKSSTHRKSAQANETRKEKFQLVFDGDDGEDGERLPNQWWWESTVAENSEQNIATVDGVGMEFHRKDLRVFRVERLFISPNGQRFIFGCYYARPHETFCDSSRMFFRNELFWTPLFDTLPLDSVVGRCLILEPQIWASGRPKAPRYLEEDVYVCEYQIDRNQRSFEKIQPKNRYYINTEPYAFNEFLERTCLKRDFTPFKITNNIETVLTTGVNRQIADEQPNNNNIPVESVNKQQQQSQNINNDNSKATVP